MHRLVHGRIGEPGGQRRVVLRREVLQLDVRRVVVPRWVAVDRRGSREGDAERVPGAPAPGATDLHPDAYAGGERSQEGRHPAGGEHPGVDVEALLGLGLDGRQGGVEPLPQDPELQRVEDLVHLVAVPLAEPELGGVDVQRYVPDQLGEPAVAHHRGDPGPQVVPDLALDLIDVVDQVRHVAVLLDELGGGLLPQPGDAGQVVAGVAAQRCELGVLRRRQAVLLLDRVRGHPAHVRHPAAVVEHGDPLVDELEGIPVAGDDQDVHAVGGGLGGEGRDDVVGLETLSADDRDPQGVEHLADERHLSLEVGWRLGPAGLVVGVRLGAEGRSGDVEGDRDVGGLLVPQHVDEHRGEAVDGVGRLAGRGREVLDRQGEEGPVGQRVAVEQEQPRAGRDRVCCRGGHGAESRRRPAR